MHLPWERFKQVRPSAHDATTIANQSKTSFILRLKYDSCPHTISKLVINHFQLQLKWFAARLDIVCRQESHFSRKLKLVFDWFATVVASCVLGLTDAPAKYWSGRDRPVSSSWSQQLSLVFLALLYCVVLITSPFWDLFVIMSCKNGNEKVSLEKKTRIMSIEIKQEIIRQTWACRSFVWVVRK